MYLCRKSWKGLLLHTKLWDKLETSRLSFYQRMPPSLSLPSLTGRNTFACPNVLSCSRDVLALVVHGVRVYPRLAPSSGIFCYESFARNE